MTCAFLKDWNCPEVEADYSRLGKTGSRQVAGAVGRRLPSAPAFCSVCIYGIIYAVNNQEGGFDQLSQDDRR